MHVVLFVRVLVKVLEVGVTFQGRHPWRLNPLLLNYLPINAVEPVALFNLL